ncbi:MAG: hypothetical protein EBU88_16740, partial [Acidobacteria bacterium]|nr:hypothetical protein [Acidobacteriota bacterium]
MAYWFCFSNFERSVPVKQAAVLEVGELTRRVAVTPQKGLLERSRPVIRRSVPALVATGQTSGEVTVISAAYNSGSSPLAPESLVSAYGSGLATQSGSASSTPLPTLLAGTTVKVNDQFAGLLYVSPTQINFLMPSGLQSGNATIVIVAADGRVSQGSITIAPVAPGIITANSDGLGVPAGSLLRIKSAEQQLFEPISQVDPSSGKNIPLVIVPGNLNENLYLVLFGTGWRGRSSLDAVTASPGLSTSDL